MNAIAVGTAMLLAALSAQTTIAHGPAAADAAGSGHAAEIDAISAYAGTWRTESIHLATPYSKAGKETATLRNDCWRSGEFYACHQYVNGDSGALIVYLYQTKEDAYAINSVMPGSGAAEHGKLIIRGNVWTYPWAYTAKGKTTWFRVVNIFISADAIEYRSEYSTDRVHWVRMATGQDRRVSGAMPD